MSNLATIDQATVYPEDLPDHDGQIERYAAAGLTGPEAFTLETRAAHILTMGRRALLEIGAELLQAREEAKHGTWGTFLARCGVTERTAENYMNVVRSFGDKPEMISALPPTALYAMAAPSADPVVVGEIVQEVRSGAGPAPTVAEVKQRLAPTPAPMPTLTPRPATPPIEPAGEEEIAAPPPAARPTPTLTPLARSATLPPALPMATAPDVQARKLLVAKRMLLATTLDLIEAELAAAAGPEIIIHQDRAREAARLFVHNPTLGGAAAMLAFSALVRSEDAA